MAGQIGTISSVIAKRRRDLAQKQEAVARRAGLSQTYLSRIEVGKVNPRLTTLQDVARALGMELVLVPDETLPAVHALLEPGASQANAPLIVAESD